MIKEANRLSNRIIKHFFIDFLYPLCRFALTAGYQLSARKIVNAIHTYTVPASSPTNVTVWFSPLGKKKNRITKIEYIRTARIVSPNFMPSEIQFFMSLKNFFISTVS